MHLVGPYLTTLNYSKRKSKTTQAQMNRWMEDYKERCKLNKRFGLPKQTFEEYLDMLHGRVKREKPGFIPLKPSTDGIVERSRSHRELYPSLNTMSGSTAKAEPKVYTGTLIKGIATMHKSNAVPIINQEQAEEISRMRRG
jgi:hypothetical protein